MPTRPRKGHWTPKLFWIRMSRGIALGEGMKDRDRVFRVAVDGHSQRQPREPGRPEGGHAAKVASERFDAHLAESVWPHLLRVAGSARPSASDDSEPVPVRNLGKPIVRDGRANPSAPTPRLTFEQGFDRPELSTENAAPIPRVRSHGQAERRRTEQELRRRAVASCQEHCGLGWSRRDVAEALALPPRTLGHWCRHFAPDDLEITPRGRPPQSATEARRADVTDFLTAHGPAISVATLKAEFSDVAQGELEALRGDFRKAWRTEHAPTNGPSTSPAGRGGPASGRATTS